MAALSRFCRSDEFRDGWVAGQGAGEVEDVSQRLVALVLIAGQGGAFLGGAAQRLIERAGQQLGVAVGVAEAVSGDRVAVVAGVADKCPAGPVRSAEHVGFRSIPVTADVRRPARSRLARSGAVRSR
jgi:hypothetical protein